MRALILNSGMGSRMGDSTKNSPKCLSMISDDVTILSNQLDILINNDIKDIVITTGAHSSMLREYVEEKYIGSNITFVHNDLFSSTNYIYSIYLARNELDDDIIIMHGDLVFSDEVFKGLLAQTSSCVVVDTTISLPEKDFKAVVKDDKVTLIGIEFFDNAYACQPLYKLKKDDWKIWLDSITYFCENGNTGVYAENALNQVSAQVGIIPYDVKGKLCQEVDTVSDLEAVKKLI
ncbi:MAG: NTP transferase domain-containing protein [Clostridia bacterium]|nr:NTP transferase domain-containing protein [Clostridia bacterium]